MQASAYDEACRHGRHRPLTHWAIEEQALIGRIDLPLPVGFAGGLRRLEAVNAAFEMDGIASYSDLCGVLAAVGLAQNFGALWALVTDGIQAGHIALHARKEKIARA